MERNSNRGAEGWSLLWRDGATSASSDALLRKKGDWERRMEVADGQQSEVNHFQWGLIRDQVASLGRELASVRGDIDGVARDQRNLKEDVDRKASGNRDLILQLEQKVQQELFKHAAEQRARHGELHGHSCGLAGQLKELHGVHEAALADVHSKHQANDAALRDVLAELEGKHAAIHSSVSERLQAVHDLQRAEAERLHGAFHDLQRAEAERLHGVSNELVDGLRSDHSLLFESERAERAVHHSALQDRLEALERQLGREAGAQPRAVLWRTQPPQVLTLPSPMPFRIETSPMRRRACSASPLASHSAAAMQPTSPAALLPFRSGPGVFAPPIGPGGRASSFVFGPPATVVPSGFEDPGASEAGAPSR